MIERVIKSILWVVGGFKIYLGGHDGIVKKMQEVFFFKLEQENLMLILCQEFMTNHLK